MRRTLRHVLALFGVAVIALVIPVRPASGAVPEAFQTPQPGPRVVEISPHEHKSLETGSYAKGIRRFDGIVMNRL